MNNKLVFDDSYTFHTKRYCDVFNFMKNVLNRASTGTCATTGTFTLFGRRVFVIDFIFSARDIKNIILNTRPKLAILLFWKRDSYASQTANLR